MIRFRPPSVIAWGLCWKGARAARYLKFPQAKSCRVLGGRAVRSEAGTEVETVIAEYLAARPAKVDEAITQTLSVEALKIALSKLDTLPPGAGGAVNPDAHGRMNAVYLLGYYLAAAFGSAVGLAVIVLEHHLLRHGRANRCCASPRLL